MFVSISLPAQTSRPGIAWPAARPSSRARRWSSAIRSTIVSSATSAAAAAIPARCTLAAAEAAQHHAARARSPASLPARIAPIGAQRPLLSETRPCSTGAASSASGTPRATDALKSRAPSRWTRQPCRCAAAASSAVSSGERTVPPARVCVFSSDQQRGVARRRAPRPPPGRAGRLRPRAAHGSRPAISSIPIASEVRTCEEASSTTCSPGRAERQQRGEVRHPAASAPRRGGLAEQARPRARELVDGGVLAERRPAELGPPHRVPHLLRRDASRDRSGGRSSATAAGAGPGRAPVCSAPSTTRTPLTSTCSTPRAYAVRVAPSSRRRRARRSRTRRRRRRSRPRRRPRSQRPKCAAGMLVIFRIASSSRSVPCLADVVGEVVDVAGVAERVAEHVRSAAPRAVTVNVSTPRQKSGCEIISAMCSSVKSLPTTRMLSYASPASARMSK